MNLWKFEYPHNLPVAQIWTLWYFTESLLTPKDGVSVKRFEKRGQGMKL